MDNVLWTTQNIPITSLRLTILPRDMLKPQSFSPWTPTKGPKASPWTPTPLKPIVAWREQQLSLKLVRIFAFDDALWTKIYPSWDLNLRFGVSLLSPSYMPPPQPWLTTICPAAPPSPARFSRPCILKRKFGTVYFHSTWLPQTGLFAHNMQRTSSPCHEIT